MPMSHFENEEYIPEAETSAEAAPKEPVAADTLSEEIPADPQSTPQPEAAPYHGSGTGRKESPYADSPYVMHHTPRNEPPHQNPVKATKQPKKASGFWKKALAAVLVVALVAGSCAFTASVINNRWETRMYETEKQFDAKLQDLQKQISNASAKAAAGAVRPGEVMTPSQVYANCVDSVVAISCTVSTGGYYGSSQGTSAGSGFILTEDGYVITNCHVVEGATDISVITHNGTEYPAQVVGTDTANDVAVLKVEAEGLPPVTIGSSRDLAIGDMVVAIGNPLFNIYGEVVGITTAKYSGTSGSGATIEGLGFAIPIDDISGIISDLMDYGYVTGAYLGITVSDTDADSAAMFGLPTGAYVMSVEKGYAAERAGIQAKDIIIDLGGHKVTGITSLTRALRNFKAGDTTTVTVVRSGGELVLDITLDEKPQDLNAVPSQPAPETMPEEGNPEEWFEYFRRYFGD